MQGTLARAKPAFAKGAVFRATEPIAVPEERGGQTGEQ